MCLNINFRKNNMSKPVFSDLFKFSGRRNRQSYILLKLSYFLIFWLAVALSTTMIMTVPVIGFILWMAIGIGLIAAAISVVAATTQRIRDFGQSGVWVLLLLIPYVGLAFALALWFIPSSKGDNKYGSSCI